MASLDIAIAVEQLLGVADYGSANDYEALVRTWRDVRPIPTQQALQTAYNAYQSAQTAQQQASAALRTQLVTLAQSAVGVRVDALTANQQRALVALLLHKAGALNGDLTVKPLATWT